MKHLLQLFFLLLFSPYLANASPQKPLRIQLANGFEAVLIENHSSPVIAIVVMVKTGSASEDAAINGTS